MDCLREEHRLLRVPGAVRAPVVTSHQSWFGYPGDPPIRRRGGAVPGAAAYMPAGPPVLIGRLRVVVGFLEAPATCTQSNGM